MLVSNVVYNINFIRGHKLLTIKQYYSSVLINSFCFSSHAYCISYTNLKVTTTLDNSTTVAFISVVTRHPQTQKVKHRKVLLSGFYLNGHSYGFHPQTQEL